MDTHEHRSVAYGQRQAPLGWQIEACGGDFPSLSYEAGTRMCASMYVYAHDNQVGALKK